MTTTATTGHAAGLARTALVLGVAAAVLTTTLSFGSLACGAFALVLGATSIRRGQPVLPAAIGMALAATSLYVVLLEIVVLGG